MKPLFSLLLIVFMAVSFQSCVVKANPRVSKRVVYVKKAPKNHKVVVVKGRKHYVFNGKHHVKTARGYKVVRVR